MAKSMSDPLPMLQPTMFEDSGSAISSPSDERETITVEQAGDENSHPVHLPKSHLIRIIKPRAEEILELVRDRLEQRVLAREVVVERLLRDAGAARDLIDADAITVTDEGAGRVADGRNARDALGRN